MVGLNFLTEIKVPGTCPNFSLRKILLRLLLQLYQMMQRDDYPTVQGPLIGVYISSPTTFEMYFVYLQVISKAAFDPHCP